MNGNFYVKSVAMGRSAHSSQSIQSQKTEQQNAKKVHTFSLIHTHTQTHGKISIAKFGIT